MHSSKSNCVSNYNLYIVHHVGVTVYGYNVFDIKGYVYVVVYLFPYQS